MESEQLFTLEISYIGKLPLSISSEYLFYVSSIIINF